METTDQPAALSPPHMEPQPAIVEGTVVSDPAFQHEKRDPAVCGTWYWRVFGGVCSVISTACFVACAITLGKHGGTGCEFVTAIAAAFMVLGLIMIGVSVAIIVRARGISLPQTIVASTVLVVLMLIMLVAVVLNAVLIGLTSTAPDPNKSRSGTGRMANIRIARDDHGVPHVFAESRLDAAFGQGYVHAQDRLLQLELQRLAAQGRLAEHFGSTALDTDKAIHTMNFPSLGEETCRGMSSEKYAILQAYADGVNYFLNEDDHRPPEFLVFKEMLKFHKPEPFTPFDSCRITKLLQLLTIYNYGRELGRWEIANNADIPYGELVDLVPGQTNASSILHPRDMGITEQDAVAARAREAHDFAIEEALYDTEMKKYRRASAAGAAQRRLGMPGRRALDGLRKIFGDLEDPGGSNAWTARVGGQPTVGASDPHLVASMPAVWHFARLSFNNYNIAGVSMLGVPGVLIGKNDFVSWGITMALTDLTDFFVMVPDPANPTTHYVHNGVSKPYVLRHHTIAVKDESDYTLTVPVVPEYGPVINEAFEVEGGARLAFASPMLETDVTTLPAMLNSLYADQINSVQTLRDNLFAHIRTSALSIAMQDVYGAIGYCITGVHPWRAVGHTGLFPTLGNGSFDYRLKYIPYTELPTKIDTNAAQSAFIPLANNKIYPDGYKYSLGYDYMFYRIDSIRDALAANPQSLSDPAFHRALQVDETSGVWKYEYRGMLRDAAIGGAMRAKMSPAAQSAFDNLINNWDGVSSVGSLHPSRFWWWLRQMSKLPKRALAAAEQEFWMPEYYSIPTLKGPDAVRRRLCSEATNGGTCLDWAVAAWESTEAEPDKRWGIDQNRLHARHILLQGTFLACFFDRWGEKGGDPTAINVAKTADTKLDADANVDHIASNRQVYLMDPRHFGDGGNATHWYALPGGEFGNPWGDHYDDLLQDHLTNAFSVMPTGSIGSIGTGHAATLSP